ncbi:RIP metalloprotease RseP [Candidatus Thiothrix anitrata]|jgi:regulator of sigma E protease|uniref:Zinc metalloprotease n=1 Tax=Candidatus Thiothrix anitrata TaxID=2823902 RepID=A0ABX7X783_9GAMM|nr:RIP metalloprotease RseP [Candidatus Thiothrix anitrata]QTR49904.1 RIP metalloprotease RseP [Candidatus Thiothrix anitrata]
MSLLIIIPAFLVTIGILVTVHEFGHYWVARRLGVKVLRFSVGFGKPLWTRVSKDADRVEYVIAALPLGGYVKMLDEREFDENTQIPEKELHRAFNRQVLWKRAAIVFAGPLANFLLAIAVYALTFVLGVDTFRPVVEVRKDTPAALAGFQTGDTLTAINGEAVTSWDDLHMLLIEDYLTSPRLEISVTTPEGNNVQRVLDLGDKPMFKDETDFLNKAGLGLWMRGIGIAGVLEGSAAAQAGLQAGDKVLSVGGTAPQSVQDFIQIIQQHAEQTIALQIRRGDNDVSINVTPQSKDLDGKTVGSLGANVGAYMTDAVRAELAFTQRYGVFDALWLGMVKTKQMSVVTLKLMGRMLTGEVALKNISGPVTIAQFAGTTASIGLGAFLGFLAIVSISLGVLNLLPIPMLDGGHLMYYLVEWVKGSPVSAEVEAVGLRIGMALIGCLMVLALYNDFMRLMN